MEFSSGRRTLRDLWLLKYSISVRTLWRQGWLKMDGGPHSGRFDGAMVIMTLAISLNEAWYDPFRLRLQHSTDKVVHTIN